MLEGLFIIGMSMFFIGNTMIIFSAIGNFVSWIRGDNG